MRVGHAAVATAMVAAVGVNDDGVSLVAENDAALGEVVRTHLYLYLVAGEDTDVVHAHLTGDVGDDGYAVFEFYTEHCVG